MRDIINTSLLVFCFFTQKLHRIVMPNILLTNSEGPSRSDDSQLFLLLLLWSGGYHGMEFPRLFCTAWGLWGLGSLHTGLQSLLLTALRERRPLSSDCWVKYGTSILRKYLRLGSQPQRQIWTLNWISVPFLLSLGSPPGLTAIQSGHWNLLVIRDCGGCSSWEEDFH